MCSIKQIPSGETFAVRQPVLRPGKPVESCIFEGDDLPATVHFGIYEEDALAGVASVFVAASPDFSEEFQVQLRGMAVLPAHQKKGFGEKLLAAAEHYAKQQGMQFIWFNAREIAVGFYQRQGYKISSGPFPVQDIGPHYVMYKRL